MDGSVGRSDPVFVPGGSDGSGLLIGGSVGSAGASVVPGGREGASVVTVGSIGKIGAGVADSSVGSELVSKVGSEVISPLSVGAGVSPTGSGVMFIIVGIGVGLVRSNGLGVGTSGAGVLTSCNAQNSVSIKIFVSKFFSLTQQAKLTSTGLGVGLKVSICNIVGATVGSGVFLSTQVFTSFLTSTCFIIILSLLPLLLPLLPPDLLLLLPDLLDFPLFDE